MNLDSGRCESCGQALCPECGSAIGENDSICPGCDAELLLYCPICGVEVTADAVACPECGETFED